MNQVGAGHSAFSTPTNRHRPPDFLFPASICRGSFYWQAGETAFGRLSLLHTNHVSDLPFWAVFRSFLTAAAAETDIFRKIHTRGEDASSLTIPTPNERSQDAEREGLRAREGRLCRVLNDAKQVDEIRENKSFWIDGVHYVFVFDG